LLLSGASSQAEDLESYEPLTGVEQAAPRPDAPGTGAHLLLPAALE
jgi:hypothetical protein